MVGRRRPLDRLVGHLRRPEARGALIVGPAGVGKTRLADEVVATATGGGRGVVRVVGSAATIGVPYSALGSALVDVLPPASTDADGATVRAALLRALDPPTGNGADRPLVVVDDLDLVDGATARLLHQLTAEGRVALVGTLRSGTVAPDPLMGLWADERVVHVMLNPLGVADVAEVLGVALQGPVAPTAVAAFVERSRGNPLYLRELVVSAVDGGVVVPGPDGWVLASGPPLPARLAELLARRFAEVGEKGRLVLDALVVAEPLPLDVLLTMAGPEAPERCEDRDLVTVDEHAVARLAHPLLREALAAALPGARRRRIQRLVLEALEGRDGRRPDDVLRAGALRLELGDGGDGLVLAEAARWAYAYGDHDLAERTARAAIAIGGHFEARLALGASLSAQGRADDADRALSDAVTAAADDGQRARAVGRRSVHLAVRMARPADAAAAVEEALEVVDDPVWVAFLDAELVKARTFLGDTGPPTLVADGSISELNIVLATAFVAVSAGRGAEARAAVARGLELAPYHRSVLPSAVDLLRLVGGLAVVYGDGPAAGLDVLGPERQAAVERGGDAVGAVVYLQAAATLATGRVDAALALADEADRLLGTIDLVGLVGSVAATAGLALALLGRLQEARTRIDVAITHGDAAARTEVQARVAAAWCEARSGQPHLARRALEGAAERAGEVGQDVLGLLALHDAVRLGADSQTVARLVTVAGSVDGRMRDAVVGHAEATVRRRAVGLADAAQALVGCGLVPAGVEALLAAADLGRRSDPAGSARWRLRAALLADTVDAASLVEGVRPSSPITDRELAVARAAAAGLTSRAIAEQDGASTRTVDNHLGSVYRKLGLDGRTELATWWPSSRD